MLSQKIRLFLVKFESQIWFVLCFSFSPFMNVINSAFVPSHTKLLFKVKIKLRKDITFVETFLFFFLILVGLLNSFYVFVTRLLFYAFVNSWLRDFTVNVAGRPSLVYLSLSLTFWENLACLVFPILKYMRDDSLMSLLLGPRVTFFIIDKISVFLCHLFSSPLRRSYLLLLFFVFVFDTFYCIIS